MCKKESHYDVNLCNFYCREGDPPFLTDHGDGTFDIFLWDMTIVPNERVPQSMRKVWSNPGDKIISDGGSTSYYDFPEGARTLNDLIEYKKMSFARGNIFKAAFRLGEKDGADELYDLNKIIYFANRLKKQLETGD